MFDNKMKEYIKEKLESALWGIKRGIVYTMLLLNIGNITSMEKVQKEDTKNKLPTQNTTEETISPPSAKTDTQKDVVKVVKLPQKQENKPQTNNPVKKTSPSVTKIEPEKKAKKTTPKKAKEKKQPNKQEKHAPIRVVDDDLISTHSNNVIKTKTNEMYRDICKKYKSEYISLNDLLDNTKIEIQDVCSVLSQSPESICDIMPGKTSILLARAASNVKGGGKQQCLLGVQRIFDNAGLSGIISGDDKDWPAKIRGCSSNSACNAYIPLEKSKRFIVITVNNEAYNKSSASNENKKMRAWSKKLPIGSVVITDNKIADEYQGRVYRDLTRVYGRGGKIHGHICVKDVNHLYKSDIVEPNGPNFSAYGDNIKVALPKDVKIKKELLLKIVEAYQTREVLGKKRSYNNQVSQYISDIFISRG